MQELLLDKVCPVCGKVHESKHVYRRGEFYSDRDREDWSNGNTVYHIVCNECKTNKDAFQLCHTCKTPLGYKAGLSGKGVAMSAICKFCDQPKVVDNSIESLLKIKQDVKYFLTIGKEQRDVIEANLDNALYELRDYKSSLLDEKREMLDLYMNCEMYEHIKATDTGISKQTQEIVDVLTGKTPVEGTMERKMAMTANFGKLAEVAEEFSKKSYKDIKAYSKIKLVNDDFCIVGDYLVADYIDTCKVASDALYGTDFHVGLSVDIEMFIKAYNFVYQGIQVDCTIELDEVYSFNPDIALNANRCKFLFDMLSAIEKQDVQLLQEVNFDKRLPKPLMYCLEDVANCKEGK